MTAPKRANTEVRLQNKGHHDPIRYHSRFVRDRCMTSAPAKGTVVTFDLKSTDLSLVVLHLKSADWDLFMSDWTARFGDVPQFFNGDPVLIDVTGLTEDTVMPDWVALKTWCVTQRMQPIGIKCHLDPWQISARKAGWMIIDDAFESALSPLKTVATTHEAATNAVPTPAHASASPAVSAADSLPAMVIDRPLRSGQQVYAKGRDLVVMAIVNPGAEVIADGNIHVYAPLRGKAMAGARGYHQARIFSLCMEAELVSIAGVYRTREKDFPADVLGKPTQVQLVENEKGETLTFTPIV